MTENLADKSIQRIVIVGGGSAGWITAGLIAAEHVAPNSGISVTLVESPQVKTIGVGEGTWPTMRTTLQRIGISETEFLTECSASFKQGTRFVGWLTGEDDDIYYHPFSAPTGFAHINLVPFWQARRDEMSFVNAVTVQGQVCDRNLAPKQETTPEYAGVVNYAYHLDAGKFAELLQRHCTQRLGVRHIVDHVTAINGQADQDIRSISTEKSGDIEGDLFVDCTGFSSMLLGRHYGIRYLDRKDVLFNDSALAVQVPYADEAGPIASQTNSTARDAGWIWDIGLVHRRGLGYTYSSAHTEDARAEQVLRDYISATSGQSGKQYDLRKISFRPGHREVFWHQNCVAVGMSSGFLEPLEASALVLVELAGRMLSDSLPANRALMDTVARRYNETFLYRWDRIIDFLKLHYVLSRRNDSEYWKDNRQASSIPERLRELLALWHFQVPWHADFPRTDEIFSSASYQYVLYGMGFWTQAGGPAGLKRRAEQAQRLFAENIKQTSRIIAHLPGNRELLSRIHERGLPVAQAG
ncbi:MAG: tryptophan halogenase family protein [Xanthomonadales bacterium]|nr:tryptophan halogenase family protein [Xanthomonadales bacterium]